MNRTDLFKALGVKISSRQQAAYRRKGFWGKTSLLDLWDQTVQRKPDKICIADGHGLELSYARADAQGDAIAAFLRDKGVLPGDVVSFQLPGWAEYLPICVACFKSGAIANPIMPNWRAEEIRQALLLCESKVIFIPAVYRSFSHAAMMKSLKPHLPFLRACVSIDKYADHNTPASEASDGAYPDLQSVLSQYANAAPGQRPKTTGGDLAAMLFTSGSDGKAKGVMFTHNNIIAAERAFMRGLALGENDIMFMPSPLGHATGFHHGIVAPFMAGGKSVVQDIFRADEALGMIQKFRCTASMGATPFLHDLLQALRKGAYDISSLRFFICGGTPVPESLVRDAVQAGFKIITVYGSTESVPHTATAIDDPPEKAAQSSGRSLAGIEVRVVDEQRKPLPSGMIGELASRGPNLFVGYYKNPEATAKAIDDDGWHYSGDLGTLDANGYVRVIGRKKDIIVRGGENISSVEVENFLLRHPNISEAAVVAMPDPRLGERACAYVVLRDPRRSFDMAEMTDFFSELGIAKFKYPERVETVLALPRTESGKIRKYLLRTDIAAKIGKERLAELMPQYPTLKSTNE